MAYDRDSITLTYMMTKKDFEAIANVLNVNGADMSLCMDMADVLEDSNERFNRNLFLQASTVGMRALADAAPARLARQVGL